eukprot:CAMPEP_0181121150 /NCGR_PEP_ID=MMETSP1071-20121207/24574_1 /TAXON_ID=35127 /ORGANISM="Thalassiosira sp., Strain NH16" /LENGTH=730 /DNA_ID=CAMNT_0023205929 /DNA_START=48 /DNA_END=2240 /DNA_ORIENTATION=-
MVSEENRAGLYVAIPVYFVILALVAYVSNRKLKRLEKNQQTDQLTGHYLGGRSFGPIVVAGTIFASQFSGYTVVGVPNESFRTGFYGFRWTATFPGIIFGFMGTGVRLRKASLVRNHSTPIDFITDRFRSQLLRYTVVVIQVLASIVYLAAQVNALQSTFNDMFGFDPDDVWPVIVIMVIILTFEWMGGLAVVALSDSIQGIIMVISFICLPIVILSKFGGWKGIDPLTYPRKDFYQTPSSGEQLMFWQFTLLNISFFALPHMVQRIYAARDLPSLKAGFLIQTIGPWFTTFVGVFIGTMGVIILAQNGKDPNPPSPFTAIIEEVMSTGGFAYVIGVIALTSSLAAIMSTTDSLIIAISQLITVEVIWPLRPNGTQRQLAWSGRITSLLSVSVALITGILWKKGVGALSAINFPIIIQAIPSYLHGLYVRKERRRLHPWSLAFGAIVGLVYVFAFYFGYMYGNDSAKPIDAGITGVLLNIILAYLIDILWFDRAKLRCFGTNKDEKESDPFKPPEWDIPSGLRFGEELLTAPLLDDMMAGFPEPMRDPTVCAMFFVLVTIITPIVAEGQPVINADTGQFVTDPPVVRGLPWWFFKQILITIIPYIALLKIIWDMPNEYPFDEEKVDKDGINAELLELTPIEMNFRSNFDAPNESILRRRSTVSIKMEALGLSSRKVVHEDAIDLVPNESRLSFIIRKEEFEASGRHLMDGREDINDGEHLTSVPENNENK